MSNLVSRKSGVERNKFDSVGDAVGNLCLTAGAFGLGGLAVAALLPFISFFWLMIGLIALGVFTKNWGGK